MRVIALLKKEIVKDSTLNIFASLILTAVIQLLAYPFLGKYFSAAEYGQILILMGVVYAVAVSLGNSLNNTRLLLNSKYSTRGIVGDYNLLFLMALLTGVVIVWILMSILFDNSIYVQFGCLIIMALVMFRAYYSVGYRIIINYKMIVYSSIAGCIGYIIGIYLTKLTDQWIYVFIVGELFSCVFILFSSKLVKERLQSTPMFKQSLTKYLLVMSAAIIANIMMYVDRFYIYPVLGADQVSIYTVASFIGKTAGIILVPISGVLLTYYAKEKELDIKKFFSRTVLFFVITTVVYLFIIIMGKPITKILYPTIYYESMPYFYIATLAAIVFVFGSTIQPTVLRFCSTKWMPTIQGIYLIVYLVLGYLGMRYFDLMGFCYAILISNIVYVLLMFYVVFRTQQVKSLLVNKME